MKKKYIEPEMDIVSVPAYCSNPGFGESSVNGGGLTKEHSSDVDDEEYESEGGNYGDLW